MLAHAAALFFVSFGGAVAGCAPGLRLDLDPCDGSDNDADGTVDEGRGTEIGCDDDEICVRAVCTYDCGDGACSARTGETCTTCAADCGACPRCGDGTCNPGESCSACPSDCGACPSCGDGACDASEGCATCRQDCGLCFGECRSCATSADCESGHRCAQRVCDGARGCYSSSAGATCPTVSGESCPAVSAYDRCTTDGQCGPRMACSGQRCTFIGGGTCSAEDCPPAPSGYPGLAVNSLCTDSGGSLSYSCFLTCTSTCPYGMTCNAGRCG